MVVRDLVGIAPVEVDQPGFGQPGERGVDPLRQALGRQVGATPEGRDGQAGAREAGRADRADRDAALRHQAEQGRLALPLARGFDALPGDQAGQATGRTGLAGHTVRNPATGGLANLVSWQGIEPASQWQREPTLFRLMTERGVTVGSVGPARFAGSGLTVAALGGGTYLPAESLAQRVDTTLARLAEPGLVYLYWGDADKIAHHHGWQSPRWADGLSELDREIGRLARSLPPGTVLVVTADHGMVDVDPRALVDVATTPELAMGVELVAGEPRASHVYLMAGSDEGERDAALLRWRTMLGESALVTTRADAVAAGWFGPVADHVLPMIGDLVVAATGRAGVVDSRTQAPASLLLRGMHGSLTPGEMLVPLFVVA